MLEVSNLTKSYNVGDSSLRAVDNANLKVKTGEFISIMGPSGSGKSTFLNLIGGIEQPTAGTIKVDKTQIENLSEDALAMMRRKKISFIYQFFSLLPELSAAENIILPLLIAGDRQASRQDRLEETLRLVDLIERKNHLPSQ